jgi:hypothetical protein
MVDAWCQQETVFPVEPFVICAIAPRLTVACTQMFGIGDTRDPTPLFNDRYPLAKYTLTPASLNDRLSLHL